MKRAGRPYRSTHRAILALTVLFPVLVACLATPSAFAAPPAVASGRSAVVDDRVTAALANGGLVRTIVTFAVAEGEAPSAPPDAARARLAGPGFEAGPRYANFPVMAAALDATTLERLLEDPAVLQVGPDPIVDAQLGESVPLVDLDDLHAINYTAAGAKVAIVDTGIDLDHADLVDAIVDEVCFCDDGAPGPAGCCPNGRDSQIGTGAGQDDHGHGTSVSGVVTSASVHADVGGAPDAQLLAVKVLSSTGSGTVADVLAGLDWVLSNHPDADVLNMSLGFGLYSGDCDSADAVTSAFASAVDLLYAAGVLTVAGSGNDRSGTGMIAPACIANAVSVGAVWDADIGSDTRYGCTDATTQPDQVTCWSNASTTTDVFAPGGRITTSKLNGTVRTGYGTSYATPMVSACAAVLSRAHPGATLDAIAQALTTSNVSVVDATNGLSYPRLSCIDAHASLTPGVPTGQGVGWGAILLLVAVIGALAARGSALRA